MHIGVNSGSSGWSKYVLEGTKKKPRDTSKVELLDGDPELGDYLSENNNYKEKYYLILLKFKGKPSDEILHNAYYDFKEQFFIGYEDDEYHIDAVVHKDTENYHIHCRVPKQNLKTNTHLQLYYDPKDRKRKEKIQDYINKKYNLETVEENKRVVVEDKSEQINVWREEHDQEPLEFNLSNKKKRADIEKYINGKVGECIKKGLIKSQDDIREMLEAQDLKVLKFDFDRRKNFAYVTVQNSTGKMRIKGDFYSDDFFQIVQEQDKIKIIDENKYIKKELDILDVIKNDLKTLNDKRVEVVEKKFAKHRQRADKLYSYAQDEEIITEVKEESKNILDKLYSFLNALKNEFTSTFKKRYNDYTSTLDDTYLDDTTPSQEVLNDISFNNYKTQNTQSETNIAQTIDDTYIEVEIPLDAHKNDELIEKIISKAKDLNANFELREIQKNNKESFEDIRDINSSSIGEKETSTLVKKRKRKN